MLSEAKLVGTNLDMVLGGLKSIEVLVNLYYEVANEAISEQSVKDKFELVLRRHGIPLREDSSSLLVLTLESKRIASRLEAPASQSTLTERFVKAVSERRYYRIDVKLQELVLVERGASMVRVPGTVWFDGLQTFGPTSDRESELLGMVERLAEHFSNVYLANQQNGGR